MNLNWLRLTTVTAVLEEGKKKKTTEQEGRVATVVKYCI